MRKDRRAFEMGEVVGPAVADGGLSLSCGGIEEHGAEAREVIFSPAADRGEGGLIRPGEEGGIEDLVAEEKRRERCVGGAGDPDQQDARADGEGDGAGEFPGEAGGAAGRAGLLAALAEVEDEADDDNGGDHAD